MSKTRKNKRRAKVTTQFINKKKKKKYTIKRKSNKIRNKEKKKNNTIERKSNKKRKKKDTKKRMNKKTNTGRGIINIVLTNIDTEEEYRINVDQNEGIIGELRKKLLTEEYHFSDFNDIEYVMFGNDKITGRDIYERFKTHGIEDGARLSVKIEEGSHERHCDLYDGGDRCNCAKNEIFRYIGDI